MTTTIKYLAPERRINIDHIIDTIGIEPGTGATNDDYDRIDRERVAAAQAAHPDETWHLTEPNHDTVLVDPYGDFWTYQVFDDYEDDDTSGWKQHRIGMMGADGRYTTHPMTEDWDVARSYGPFRTATPDDGEPIVHFTYWPEWKDGSGVGEPYILTYPEPPIGAPTKPKATS